MTEEPRMPTLAEQLEGDLGVARRHVERLRLRQLPPSPAVLREISDSIERCVARIRAEVRT